MVTNNKFKVIALLRTFTPNELREFYKYLQSPYLNNRPEAVRLFEVIRPMIRNGKEIPPREDLHASVFPGKPFEDGRLRSTMSFLNKNAIQFLTLRDFTEDKNIFSSRKAKVLAERGINKEARGALDQAGIALQNNPYRNAEHLESAYQLFLQAYRLKMSGAVDEELNLQALSDLLDTGYLSRKLWQSCFLLSRNIIAGSEYDFGFLEILLENLGEEHLKTPSIAIYYYCYRSLTQPEDFSNFINFKNALLTHESYFPKDELRDLYILAVNFCIRQYNAGNQDFLPQQFDFYRKGFEQGFFLIEGELSRYTYQNAITVALVLEELNWVEQFIHDYRDLLPEEHRESMFAINKARLDYTKKEYGNALVALQRTRFRDIHLGLAARILQMKIYFELNEFDLLESHLSALKTFIQRKKELGYHRENYLNTLRFTRKLLEVNPFDKEKRAVLKQEIQDTKALAERDWLLKYC